jgi:hypothetical protein
MVSGPASTPVAVSLARSSAMSSTASAASAVGAERGRRKRGLERGLTLAPMAGQQLIQPRAGDAVGGGDSATDLFSTTTAVISKRVRHPGAAARCGINVGACLAGTLDTGDHSARDLPTHQSGVS